jgi:hypothetical protein
VKLLPPWDMSDEVTRRQWLLRLGEMIVLAGISGLVPEISTHLHSVEEEYAGLPPGLYAPSGDNLVHALASVHRHSAPPPGTETDYVQPSSSPFQPLFFSNEEFRIVTRLAEIILGTVEAPALSQTTQWLDLWFLSAKGVREAARNLDPLHRALAIAFYGEKPVRDLETADSAAVARDGIAAFSHLSEKEHGCGFLELSAAQQEELARSIGTTEPHNPLRKFFEVIRREAIRGYYTSAEGLQELNYKGNSYYPYCPGCELIHGRDAARK